MCVALCSLVWRPAVIPLPPVLGRSGSRSVAMLIAAFRFAKTILINAAVRPASRRMVTPYRLRTRAARGLGRARDAIPYVRRDNTAGTGAVYLELRAVARRSPLRCLRAVLT